MGWDEGSREDLDQDWVDRAKAAPEEEEIFDQLEELPPDVVKELLAEEADAEADSDEVDYNMFPMGSERSHGIISQAHRNFNGVDVLDLSGHDLGVIGEQSLSILQNYSGVDLSDNKISHLPEGFRSLRNLELIDLSQNDFAEFPQQILDLRQLVDVNLSYNKVRRIPRAIAQLNELSRLDLSGCGLQEVPEVLASLPNLRSLVMEANSITDIPRKFIERGKLEILSLERNGLENFPPNVLDLPNLKALYLANNSIEELPIKIGRLGRLEMLNIRGNSIAVLPDTVGDLVNLRTLDAGENELARVPGSLSQLQSLQALALDNNELRDLPPELSQLPRDISLDLDANPFPDVLESLIFQGTTSLFAYLRSLHNSTPQYEAKLILVGEGGVGKSTLIAALRGDAFVPHRPTTHGIELGRLDVPHPKLPNLIRLNSWDFGGQDVYRITHQFFFSRRALYLLVWKPREGYEQGSIEEWCRRIRLRVGSDARILIVATHADERRPEFDYSYLQSKYPDLLIGNFAIDSESGRGIEELRIAVADAASALPQMGELISDNWNRARQSVVSLNRPHISRMSFERTCAAESMDEESTQALANLLHDLGHVIHYGDDEGLHDLVVLQPEWLTKAIGYVLEDETTRTRGGVLEHARLQEIWSGSGIKDAKGYPEDFHPYFLRLMEKFDITYRLPDEPASLVAQLVPYERPGSVEWEGLVRNSETRKLRLVCHMADEAPGLVAWLTVRNHQFSVGRHWRRGVLLVHEAYASQALLELAQNNRDLQLSVLGPAPEYFFHLLRDGIEELVRRRWKGLSYQFLIPCNQIVEKQRCTGSFSYRTLIKFRQRRESRIICQSCAEWSDVAELLTGFGDQSGPIDEMLSELTRSQKANTEALQRLEIYAANSASLLRATLRVLSAEVSDTPRLFTLVPENRSRVVNTISLRQHFMLTLWCEEPGAEHRLDEATYRFKPPKEWVENVGPYVNLVVKVLRVVVPLAIGAYAAAISPAVLSRQKADLDLTKVIAERFPLPSAPRDDAPEQPSDGLTRAEGAGLRAFRQLLMSLDPSAGYGGLRRVRSVSGDLLWVCSEHHRYYDPGLPELGYTQAASAIDLA